MKRQQRLFFHLLIWFDLVDRMWSHEKATISERPISVVASL
ncbi:hypothetical protein [Peribacillus sp. NPDC096540]